MMVPRWGEIGWKPIPEIVYDKIKHGFLKRHSWIHYLLHCSYCVIFSGMRGNYVWFTPREWVNIKKD